MTPVREHYIQQLGLLRDELLHMGSLVEQALKLSIRSIEVWNTTVAAQVIDGDKEIDKAQKEIEESVIRLIATQQPVASDLRLVGSVFAIASELERIGDYARHIARVVKKTSSPLEISALSRIAEMSEIAQKMLNLSLESFLHQDSEIAHSLAAYDKQADELEARLREELIEVARTSPQHFEPVLDLINVAHILERVADRTTNIGERVVFMETSEVVSLNP
jgi:phosphate transport system protein